MHRDWWGPLGRVAGEYGLSPAEISELMAVAAS